MRVRESDGRCRSWKLERSCAVWSVGRQQQRAIQAAAVAGSLALLSHRGRIVLVVVIVVIVVIEVRHAHSHTAARQVGEVALQFKPHRSASRHTAHVDRRSRSIRTISNAARHQNAFQRDSGGGGVDRTAGGQCWLIGASTRAAGGR